MFGFIRGGGRLTAALILMISPSLATAGKGGQENCVELSVEVEMGRTYFGGAATGVVDLCLGRGAERCHRMTLPGRTFKKSFSVSLDEDSQFAFGDHPHVDHPDDWDEIELRLTDGAAAISISRVFVETAFYSGQNSDTCNSSDLAGESASGRFALIDWDVSDVDADAHPLGSASLQIGVGASLDLGDEIEFSRRKSLCQSATGDDCSDPGEAETHFRIQPRLIRNAVSDIGQSGLAKFSGSYAGTSQSGCDEFYSYHFANGHPERFEATLDACPDGEDGRYCYVEDEGDRVIPSGGRSLNLTGFPHGGWKQNGRLYKARFYRDGTTGDRTSLRDFPSVEPDKGCDDGLDCHSTWEIDTSYEHVPQTGDYLVRVDRCDLGLHHVMMLTDDDFGTEHDGLWVESGRLRSKIIDGSRFVEARERGLDINSRCIDECSRTCSGFRYKYYVGDALSRDD
jgi:hypothetical protein